MPSRTPIPQFPGLWNRDPIFAMLLTPSYSVSFRQCFGCRLSIAAGDKQQRSACDLSALPSARLLAKYRNDTSSMFGSDDIITPSTFLRSNMAASIKRASGNDLRQPICRSCLADLRSANSNRGLESTHRISGNSTA